MNRIFIFLFLSVLYGCQPKQQKELPIEKRADSLIYMPDVSPDKFDADRDSAELLAMYKRALETAKPQVGKSKFYKQLDTVEYGRMAWTGEIYLGDLFADKNKYLLIRRVSAFGSDDVAYADIFICSGRSLRKIASDTSGLGYYGDTIQDISGDKHLDYIMYSYSPTGCCPRDNHEALIYDIRSKSFLRESLFNPEYFPEQRIVIEAGYGYPGAMEFEKYAWNGPRKILIEKIEPADISNNIAGGKPPKKIRRIKYPNGEEEILNSVPWEYRKLNLYGRFMADE